MEPNRFNALSTTRKVVQAVFFSDVLENPNLPDKRIAHTEANHVGLQSLKRLPVSIGKERNWPFGGIIR